jgi:putative ABC transport system permease protein
MRLLPWDYGVRNLLRRPLRTGLTAVGLTLVIFLLLMVTGFLHGLDSSLERSGEEQVVMIHSIATPDNLENSSISDQVPALVKNELSSVMLHRGNAPALSPELVIATTVGETAEGKPTSLALLRGVGIEVFSVRRKVCIVDGRFPKSGELLVGRLAATKMGKTPEELATGQSIVIEGRRWTVSGHFAAPGTLLEAELWCALDDLKQHAKRPNDVSLVAMRLDPHGDRNKHLSELDAFQFRHRDLEIAYSAETEYYGSLVKHYQPLRALAWLMVLLIACAGACGAINTMYAAVTSRVREFGALQALGFPRRAIALSLLQESVLLAALSTLAAAGLAILLLQGIAVRFTMGAFALQVDRQALLIGCGAGLILGIIGAIPPAIRAFRLSIADALKAV